jgi:hypothetical protein
MAEDVKQEMNATPGCIPSKWTRNTVADGDWLQKYTIGPLSSRDNFLADKISGAELNIDEEIEARKAGDAYLSANLIGFSAEYFEFKDNVETSAENLSAALQAEIDRAKSVERQEIDDRANADIAINQRIDKLEAATDVVMVFSTYDEFSSTSGDVLSGLTDRDVVKILRDEHYIPEGDPDESSEDDDYFQVYYQWHDNTHSATLPDWKGWSAIGSLDPYYSISEIDNITAGIYQTIEDVSATVSSNYLSAKGAVLTGRNIVITEDPNNPKITIATKDVVDFEKVSATTAYGSSAKFDNISSTSLIALTATGNSAKFTDFSGTNIQGGTKTATIDALITSAQNGQDAYDKISAAYWSAYKDSTHSGSGKLSANFSISAGENLDMEISDNIIKLNGKPAGVIHDDNLSGLGVQGDLLGLNSAINIYVPFIANQNRNSAIVEIGNTPVPYNMGTYNEGFAVYRNHTYDVPYEGTKTANLGTTINFTGMVVTHSAAGVGGYSIYSKYGDVFDLNYNGGDNLLKHLWLNKNGLNFTDNGNTSYSSNLNFVNLKFYDKQNNIPGTNTKYESQYVNASSIYKWNNTSDIVTGQSATLYAGSGINFYNAGSNRLGISVDYSTATEDSVTYVTALDGIPLSAGANYITGRCIEIGSDNSINLSSDLDVCSIVVSGDTHDPGEKTLKIDYRWISGTNNSAFPDTFYLATNYLNFQTQIPNLGPVNVWIDGQGISASGYGVGNASSKSWSEILTKIDQLPNNFNYVKANGVEDITLSTALPANTANMENGVIYLV